MELTLDPADWNQLRALAHRMVDDTLDHLATLRDQPAWQAMPPATRAALRAPFPRDGVGAEAAYAAFVEHIRPYTNGNRHPRFWGWVQGNGTPLAMLADMLASAINPHCAGFDQASTLVEQSVIAWLAEAMGFPADASGLLVSGGSMANAIGLAVARHARGNGVCYASPETHSWLDKSVGFLGCGTIRRPPLGELAAAIAADRAAGLQPLAIIGTAGTVNTGATDDLRALAAIARREQVWFHVDGAFGALARLSPALRERVAGIDEADSLGVDLHKWMYLPFEVACVLVRDAAAHRAAFAATAPYIAEQTRGPIAGGLPFAALGPELTRSFKALKVWMSLHAHGTDAFARLIEQNVAQAAYLAARIAREPRLELVAPVHLNVVCFRVRADDAVNTEVLLQLQERGIAVPSSTRIDGRIALRVAIVNHRSRREDFDALVDAVLAFSP